MCIFIIYHYVTPHICHMLYHFIYKCNLYNYICESFSVMSDSL